jgi:predicted nucleic acid-binding protein
MICYLDSSAIVKLYVDEEASDTVRELVDSSVVVATSGVAYAEVRAAFARGLREGALDEAGYRRAVASFHADWPTFLCLEAVNSLLFLAGDLTEEYRLRGFDAIHLAAAIVLQRKVKEPITFACWDSRLWEAAVTHGLSVLPKHRP